jgi:hypothetical protein
MAIAHVPIESNAKVRKSRLFDSIYSYIKQSSATIVRIYTMHEPLKVFASIGLAVFGVGLAISMRFLYYWFIGAGEGHIQSVILSAVLLIVGFQILLIGLLADVISANRKLIEDLLYRVRLMEVGRPSGTGAADPADRRDIARPSGPATE